MMRLPLDISTYVGVSYVLYELIDLDLSAISRQQLYNVKL